MATPDVILELLAGPRGLEDRAAYLRVAGDGLVTHAGGRLDRFFERSPSPGDDTADWLWLQSLPTPAQVEVVQLTDRRWADVLIRPGEHGARWVLLTEASAPIEKMQAILQHSQELTLRARDQLLLSDALAIVDAVALIPTADFRFRVVGRSPEWFAQIVADADPDRLNLAEIWTFLESFQADAEAVWQGPGARHARSGIWTESISHADPLPLEATAVRTSDGDRLLILQRAAERFVGEQRTLQQARDLSIQHQRLVKEVERKEILLHCVVHDLGSPLGAIVACLDSVLPAVADRSDLKGLVEIGLRQARRQESLIGQLLDVFRADLDALIKFTPPGDQPDLRQVIVDQVEALAAYGAMHGVSLKTDVPDRPLAVSAMTSRLQRVVANLLENAIRHSGRQTQVEITLTQDDQWARFEVTDEGPGVPDSLRDQLFDKLYQGPAGGKAGLGLYFCRMMAERWGGAIGYRARPHGACFWVRIPLVSHSPVPGD